MKRAIALCLLILFLPPLFADSIDDAEAKSRGVPVQQVQLENEQKKNAELQKRIAELQADLKAMQARAEAAEARIPGPPSTMAAASQPAASQPSSDTAAETNQDGTVQVRGYTKKDGTVVAPYTRGAPGSRKK
jgi:hypothetical protein